MVTLICEAIDFGISTSREVKAHYTDLDSALAQAHHDRSLGRHPLRIEDEAGKVLWDAAKDA